MSTPRAERMSRVDTAWLRMDNDVNLMQIVGVWLLQPGITLAALRARVDERLLQVDRFRQRVVHDAVGAHWVFEDDVDLAHHVQLGALERYDGEPERLALQRLCGELASTPLDPRRPLWQFHLVEAYDGGSALVARIHHCIGDGLALIAVMLGITDGGPAPPPRRAADLEVPHDGDWLAEAVLRPLTDLTVKAIGRYGHGVARSIDALGHAEPGGLTVDLARAGVQVLGDAAALALLANDTPTSLKGRPSGRKRVAWSEPLPLDEVKAVGKALGCSVNDVLLACAAGAFGDYLRARGEPVDGAEIRAMVPVNLRPPQDAWKLGNRFGLAPLVLPVGIANPVQRVHEVHARMAQMKHSTQPLLAYFLLSVSGLFVKPVQDSLLDLFARKTTAVMTNVPGPAEPLRFCGSTLRQCLFWVPASGDIGVGVSILSYAGGVQFGLVTDEALVAEPQQVIDRFAPQFEQLLWLSLMLPWDGRDAGP